MGNRRGATHTQGKAEFGLDAAKARFRDAGPARIAVQVLSAADKGYATRMVDAETFTIKGIGMDEALFFMAPDPTTDVTPPPMKVGLVQMRAFLPHTFACEDPNTARMEALKFVLRIEENDRPAALERMVRIGEQGGPK